MKRDIDLARQIMLVIENAPFDGSWIQIDIKGCSKQEVTYHIMQLAKAGLVEADDVTESPEIDWRARDLTWQGHEFLAAAKNETIWQKAKQFIQEKGGTATFSVINTVLSQIALKQVGL